MFLPSINSCCFYDLTWTPCHLLSFLYAASDGYSRLNSEVIQLLAFPKIRAGVKMVNGHHCLLTPSAWTCICWGIQPFTLPLNAFEGYIIIAHFRKRSDSGEVASPPPLKPVKSHQCNMSVKSETGSRKWSLTLDLPCGLNEWNYRINEMKEILAGKSNGE